MRSLLIAALAAVAFAPQQGGDESNPEGPPAAPVASCCEGGVELALARCTGSASCRACTNCSRCAHCKGGGTCGVCAPPRRPGMPSSLPPAKSSAERARERAEAKAAEDAR